MHNEQIFLLKIVIFSLLLKKCLAQRRIVEGTKVHNEVRFMAYLVKSELSEKSYHGWTCGGAIVSPMHILTAAACVIDVDHLYAIVGYNKYVGADALDDDPCTRNRKKRVIKTCAPKSYNVEFNGWTNHDIGIAVLEGPLDFTDATYKIDCSYPPALIKVNFNPQYEVPDTDVVAMGWGHSQKLRLPEDLQDHNEQFLREASLLIVKRDICEKKFDYSPNVERIVGNDIICVEGQGNLNIEGKLRLDDYERFKDDLNKETNETTHSSTNDTLNNNKTDKPEESKKDSKETTAFKKIPEPLSSTTTEKHETTKIITTTTTTSTTVETSKDKSRLRSYTLKSQYLDLYDDDAAYDELFKKMGARRRRNGQRYVNTRRLGICQNDHGGPLIAWMGVNPIVIGVASTNLYNGSYDCISPNLFTSTTKNEWFIKCVVTDDPKYLRRCNKLALRSGQSEINEVISDWNPKSNHHKRAREDQKVLPAAADLQRALGSFLRDYQNTHKDKEPANQHEIKSLSNFEKQLHGNQKAHNTHNRASQKKRPKYSHHRTTPDKQPHDILRQRVVPKHKENIPRLKQHRPTPRVPKYYQQNTTYQKQVSYYPQNIINHQQKVLNDQQIIPNQQQQALYQQSIPNYQQNIPNYQQSIPNYQQNIPNYQQNIPNYQQNIPNYLQNIPKYAHQAPNYKQNTPNHEQQPTYGLSDPQNRHKVTLLKLRPQKYIRHIIRRTTPNIIITRTNSKTPGQYVRKRTVIWRRSRTRIERSSLTTHYRNQSENTNSPPSGRSRFFVKIKV